MYEHFVHASKRSVLEITWRVIPIFFIENLTKFDCILPAEEFKIKRLTTGKGNLINVFSQDKMILWEILVTFKIKQIF